MESILSSKYQVVIPKDIRRKFNMKPGQKIVITEVDGTIQLAKSTASRKGWREHIGSLPANAWGNDPVKTIRRIRDTEWS